MPEYTLEVTSTPVGATLEHLSAFHEQLLRRAPGAACVLDREQGTLSATYQCEMGDLPGAVARGLDWWRRASASCASYPQLPVARIECYEEEV